MVEYIVTITPVTGDGEAEKQSSRTTMRICAEDGHVYAKELTVRVGEDARLGPGDLLQVDLDLLMQAFVVKRPTTEVAPGVSAVGAVRPYQAAVSALPNAAPVAPNGAPVKSDRVYRRMPDPAELKDVFLQNRTITGVAQHYGVPTHTAQGWITRLRRKGVLPSSK